MDRRLILWSIVAALAGFLFGFDTVVISGAEKTLQKLWNLSAVMHGLAMGSALWGTVLGSMVGGWPTDHFGRKKTLLWVGALFLIGSLWSALANDVYSFMIARFIGGIAIGISTIAAPLYISEISPPAHRGRLAGMFQFNIVFGILVAYGSNFLLGGFGENAWRWMLGVMVLPSVVYTLACLLIPESPRWLISRRGDRSKGEAVLKLIHPSASAAEISDLADSMRPSESRQTQGGFWSSRLKTPILLAFFVAFFNQLSGINAILYFAPRIFGMTGSEDALAQAIGIGITNLIFTFVGLWLIDRIGRRTLLYIGSFGYIISLGLCALAFFTWAPQFRAASSAVDLKAAVDSMKDANPARVAKLEEELKDKKSALVAATAEPKSGAQPVVLLENANLESVKATADEALSQASKAAGSGGMMVLICIFAFIAAHAIGQGAVIWVFISEIFPDQYRAAGQALGSATHWVFAAALTTVFPLMMAKMAPGTVFLFFAFMMVLQLVWVKFMVPETKGVPLEEMEAKLGIASK
ncbi:sugar porter family MFS transporter [Luteolibacter flavescens]|uniref:Sugar porter family MFS transporter n=1 Tax=Luteolibacter flavescens TaxID=1859460 RepID=A0ABT3FVM6_9BACT|nr:sugar porter family MFS transporter [Luteolibacter flavescens]MCW1887645.1 sugar porter family MFS transporter [Luteolibacter flavescens]